MESMERPFHMLIPMALFITPFPKVFGKSPCGGYTAPCCSDCSLFSSVAHSLQQGHLQGGKGKEIQTKALEFINLPLKFTAAEQTNPLSGAFFFQWVLGFKDHLGKDFAGAHAVPSIEVSASIMLRASVFANKYC